MRDCMPDEVKKEYDDLIWKVQSNRKDKRHKIMNSILSHGLNASQLLMKSKGTDLIWIKRNFVLSAAQGPDILAWLLCAWHNSMQDRNTAAFLSYFCSSLIRGPLLCVLGQACCCGCRLKRVARLAVHPHSSGLPLLTTPALLLQKYFIFP